MQNLILPLPTSRATDTIDEGPFASEEQNFTSGVATEQVCKKHIKKHLMLQRRFYKAKEIKKSPLLQ